MNTTTSFGARLRHGWRAFLGAWQADWRERRRDSRVLAVMALGLLLALTAATVSALALMDTLEIRQQAGEAEHDRWEHQGKKNPHSAAHYGVYVFKPLSVLSALDPGVERFVGSSVWLEAHKQNDFIHRPAADQPGVSRQFNLTPALVLQVLAPLALIFLGFAAFAREREQGTMSSLRLSGAPLGAVAAARGAMLMLLGLALALPAFAAVLAVQWHLSPGTPFVDAGLRTALLGLGALAYLGCWSALVVGVSALSSSMRGSLAALLALWVATALVLPRVAVEVAQIAAPLPSAQVFRQALDADLGEPHDPAEEARQKAELLKQYGVDDVKQLPVNWAGISLQRGEEHGNEIFDTHYGRLFATMQRQSEIAAWGAWLSPTSALAGLSAATAASDAAHHVQFIRAAEDQRRVIQRTMNDAITATPDRDGKRVDGDESLWRSVPAFVFRFQPLGAGNALRQGLPMLLALAISFLFCAWAVRRLGRSPLQ